MGKTLIVDERRLHAGMMVASCGTAFALRYARAAMEGGVQLGLYPHEAREAVYQPLGAAAERRGIKRSGVPSPAKETAARRRPVSCGVVNKFLTNFEDLMEVYLFGIQLGIE